jgi:PAS domain S-box-containing protein
LDIPLIIVSGTIGEEVAVESIRLGAHDYIMKDNLSRLCSAIARELVEAETQRKHLQAEEALIESEKQYRLLADNVSDVIFVLDMDLKYTYISPSVKKLRGYEPAEVMKQSASKTLTPSSWDLAIRTMSEARELQKSDPGGMPISRTLQLEMWRKDGSTVWTEVTFSLIRDEKQQPVAIVGVSRDITERKQAEEDLRVSAERLRKSLRGTVQAISMAVEARDPYTSGHQRRTADLARSIAHEMCLSKDQTDFIRIASTIHDIGKISVPAEILSKPTKLMDIEFSLIKAHSQGGYEILKDIEFPWPVADVILQHHERMDGSGYPNGLKGEAILLEARILAVADVVEAMASYRPYRPARGIEAALDEIAKNKGILYDPDVVGACLRLFQDKGYKIVD